VLFIEEGSAVYSHDPETRAKNINFIREICERYSFTYTIVPIERIFDIDSAVDTFLDMRIADPETALKIEEEKK
jgi:hypothetical protein